MIKPAKFSGNKLRSQLKMASIQIQISSNKKTALSKERMREIGMFLNEDVPKEEKARLQTEAFIHDDNMIQAYDILKLQCDLLGERAKLIEQRRQKCPPDMLSCISTLIYAEQFVDIKELSLIRKQFYDKYGKRFEEAALENKESNVNEKITRLLSISPPEQFVVQSYMIEICKQFEIDWEPKNIITQPSTTSLIPSATPVIYG